MPEQRPDNTGGFVGERHRRDLGWFAGDYVAKPRYVRCAASFLMLDHRRMVLGHSVQLEQVLIDIVSNARDAIESNRGSPGDPRNISLIVEDTGANDTIRLIVKDTGGGIPKNLISRIFEPFFTTKEVGKGTGLGLSISYGIVSDMGGTIEAANADHGAMITVTLPVAVAQSKVA